MAGPLGGRTLEEGGLLLMQCGAGLPEVLGILSGRLRYVWTLAISYNQCHRTTRLIHPFLCCWLPVVVFSKGKLDRCRLQVCSDTYTVYSAPKKYHDWEQPLKPWVYWLGRLSLPGQLIVDPFCGSGTIGCAVKTAGQGRRFLGTERDEQTAKVARGRIARTALA